MKAVKFIQDWQPYESGQVVDLPDQLADQLIADGVCEFYSFGARGATVKTTRNGGQD